MIGWLLSRIALTGPKDATLLLGEGKLRVPRGLDERLSLRVTPPMEAWLADRVAAGLGRSSSLSCRTTWDGWKRATPENSHVC